MEILEVKENKEQYMDLLLLADGQESMIQKYLNRGTLFALYEDYDLKTVAVVTKESQDTYEIKNIATLKIYQGKGYGKAMVNHIIQYCKNQGKILLVGTPESENTLIFYEGLGFVYSHTEKDFFVKNYAHPIMENGVQLRDKLYYKLILQK